MYCKSTTTAVSAARTVGTAESGTDTLLSSLPFPAEKVVDLKEALFRAKQNKILQKSLVKSVRFAPRSDFARESQLQLFLHFSQLFFFVFVLTEKSPTHFSLFFLSLIE
jgi:hypothetical protein